MGGMGSGRRWHYDAHETTDEYRTIDVRRWQRDGLLTSGHVFGWQWSREDQVVASIVVRVETRCVYLNYRHRQGDAEWTKRDYPVWLDWTPCNLGGQRPWFRCPAQGCGQRVAILYGGGIFACRHCYKLAYPSQRESFHGRARLRADRIRERLGWQAGIANAGGMKPQGMHWRTFTRLAAEHDALVDRAFAGMMERYGFKR